MTEMRFINKITNQIFNILNDKVNYDVNLTYILAKLYQIKEIDIAEVIEPYNEKTLLRLEIIFKDGSCSSYEIDDHQLIWKILSE